MGGDDLLIADNMPGDTIGMTGAINFATSAFGYTLLVNTSQSKPVLGSATLPQLDLTFSVTSSAASVENVFLYASDTDFTGAQAFLQTLGGTNSGGSGTVTGRSWGGSSNTALQFSGANLLATSGAQSGPVFSSMVPGSFTPSVSPYSLTIGVAISRTTAGTTTGDLNFAAVPVPEPASMALLGLGLAVAAASRRRHRRR
jgi:hypothetical protein